MSGLKFMKDIPFSDVYIHGTVRDSTGTKMSKSLGNVIDPLEVIAEVGSDALRYSIISITSQGQDVFLSKSKFDIGRNFANKLWNASRYVMMNLPEGEMDISLQPEDLSIEDKWILTSLNDTIEKVTSSLESYRFNDAASALYDFVWHKYCDWYLEVSKLSTRRDVTHKVLVSVLMRSLKLLHPLMPFITEEIWQKLPVKKDRWIMTSSWPAADKALHDPDAADSMEKLIGVITSVRNIRAFWNVDHKATVDVHLSVASAAEKKVFGTNAAYVERLAGCSLRSADVGAGRPERSVAALVGSTKVFVPLGDAVDIEEETARIRKKVEDIEKYLKGIEKKLSNKAFTEKAPEEVVEKEKAKQDKFRREAATLKENLNALA